MMDLKDMIQIRQISDDTTRYSLSWHVETMRFNPFEAGPSEQVCKDRLIKAIKNDVNGDTPNSIYQELLNLKRDVYQTASQPLYMGPIPDRIDRIMALVKELL